MAPLTLSPANASFGDGLPGTAILAPWSLGIGLDIASQLPGKRVTEVEIVIDNALVTFSEAQTVSFISKKDFRLEIEAISDRTDSRHWRRLCPKLEACFA